MLVDDVTHTDGGKQAGVARCPRVATVSRFPPATLHPPRFRMKCHLCVNYIEMQTDPANCDYVIVSGAQRKEERWDMEDNEQVLTTGERCGWVWTPTLILSRGPESPTPFSPLQSMRRSRSWRWTPCSAWSMARLTGARSRRPSPP